MRERRESSDDEDLDRAVSSTFDMQQLMPKWLSANLHFCRLFSARQSSCASPLTILCQSWQKWYTVYKGDTAEQKACNSLIKPHEQCLI